MILVHTLEHIGELVVRPNPNPHSIDGEDNVRAVIEYSQPSGPWLSRLIHVRHVASRTAHSNLEICRGIIIRLRKKLVVTTVVARDCVSQRFPSVLCFCARER
jgi:hypothetical protein